MRKSAGPIDSAKNPRARSEGLIVRKLDAEVLVYDRESARATCLNAFAAAVWQRCDGTADAAKIARVLGEDRAEPVDARAVWLALDQLSRSHLLDESIGIPAATLGGTSRRELLRTLGIGAAAAVPAVTTIVVPTAADAQSCFPDGFACVINEQCCSLNCNSGACGPQLGRPGPGNIFGAPRP
jgi:hypothetical protein